MTTTILIKMLGVLSKQQLQISWAAIKLRTLKKLYLIYWLIIRYHIRYWWELTCHWKGIYNIPTWFFLETWEAWWTWCGFNPLGVPMKFPYDENDMCSIEAIIPTKDGKNITFQYNNFYLNRFMKTCTTCTVIIIINKL